MPAAIEHNASRGDFGNKIDVVFDDDHCGTARLQLIQERLEVIEFVGSKSDGRFVEQYQGRIADGCPGQIDELVLAGGSVLTKVSATLASPKAAICSCATLKRWPSVRFGAI